MFRKFGIAALSALLGLGTLAAMSASAQADGIYFSFGNGARAGAYVDDYPRHHRHYGHRYDRGPRWERSCTSREAVRKARRMGLHHPRVIRESRRVIRVAGHHHRHRASIVFARAPHCPVIRYR